MDRYFAPTQCAEAAGVNAFPLSWNHDRQPYANHTWSLIAQVFNKVFADRLAVIVMSDFDRGAGLVPSLLAPDVAAGFPTLCFSTNHVFCFTADDFARTSRTRALVFWTNVAFEACRMKRVGIQDFAQLFLQTKCKIIVLSRQFVNFVCLFSSFSTWSPSPLLHWHRRRKSLRT